MNNETRKRIESINNGTAPAGYKKTKVGIVPEEWDIKRISEIAEIVSGGTPDTTNPEYWNGNVFWCTPSDITASGKYISKTAKTISQAGLQNSSANLLPVNSILMCSRATIGPRCINTVPMATNQGFKSLIVNSEYANTYFIYDAIELYISDFIALSSGSTFLELSKHDLQRYKISLPPLPEQQKIAEILTAQDAVIALMQKQIELLQKQKKAFLQKMFPKKGCNVPEIRFAGFTDAWEQRKLSEICTMHARIGWQNLRTSEFLDSGDYYLITGTDFEDGRINLSTCHYVEKDRFVQDKKIQIKNGSILITKDGTLGKVAFVENLDKPATLNAGVFNVEIIENDVDNRYLFQYLKAPFLMDYVNSKATGGTIKHLNQSILVDFPVQLPESAEQQKIGAYFSHLDSLITLHQRKLEIEQQKKKALMQLLLSGKVRVKT